MKVKGILYLGLFSILFWNCSHRQADLKNGNTSAQILQGDEAISLKVSNAECYSDRVDPSDNTAEWNVVITKAGGYKVWLASSTKDTVKLNYSKAVKVNLHDTQIEVVPGCDRIVQNSEDVSYPYYRADSYVGSVYFNEPGEYNIQVVSEKILPKPSGNVSDVNADDSGILAVILAPSLK